MLKVTTLQICLHKSVSSFHYALQTRNVLQDGQGCARENEIEKIQDPRSKSSQQSSKLAGMSKRSGTKGEVSNNNTNIPLHYNQITFKR